MYRLKRSSKVPINIEDAWNFFSNPNNLAKLTPEEMDFKITSDLDQSEIYEGMIITYTVKPIFGIPMKWMTEISQVKKLHYFVDEQKVGPYKIWHHQHHFKEIGGQTEITDIVDYVLPMGPLGKIGHQLFIKNKLEQTFNYREKQITKIFK